MYHGLHSKARAGLVPRLPGGQVSALLLEAGDLVQGLLVHMSAHRSCSIIHDHVFLWKDSRLKDVVQGLEPKDLRSGSWGAGPGLLVDVPASMESHHDVIAPVNLGSIPDRIPVERLWGSQATCFS